jgi:hypothetical protein
MKKTNKKIFISSEEDRGVLVKFLKDDVHLSFWGDEADVPRKIVFSNEDILELCSYVSNELNTKEETGKEYVTNLLNEMNARNNEG